MQLTSQVSPIFFPEPNQNTVLELGLRALDVATWMQRDADFEQFYQHKIATKNKHNEKVFFALPGSEAAQLEFHEYLLQHLVDDYQLNKLHDLSFESLWHTSLLVQEDICLLENKNGEYILSAASVCSPSNWKLEEKIGRNLDWIHQPVPDYQSTLSERVNRLFDKLKVDAPLLRFNWSVQSGNELFWRNDLPMNTGVANPYQPSWYWRVERQTLRRLPESQAIVFGIRIYLHALEVLHKMRNFQAQLRAIAKRLPEQQCDYKGLKRWLSHRPA